MNHDATHCLDYDKRKCPRVCYRAQLVEDLKNRPDLIPIPMSWAHLRGVECHLLTCDNSSKTGSGLISRAELFNRLSTLPCSDNEYKAKVYEIVQALPERG